MSYRILIVEDEVILALDLAETLEDAGYVTVGIARDMQAALRIAKDRQIDLVTMDVRLAHGTNGIDTAVRLWEDYALQSLFISASLDRETRERASKAHPVGYLDKPIGSEAVVNFLEAHFGQRAVC